MNRKHKITISIAAISIILLALIGLTYGYFLTRITGNDKEKSISVTTANLAIEYGDGTTKLLTSDTPIEPDKFSATKDFTVTNNGNEEVEYAVVLEDFSIVYATEEREATYLKYPNDMKMTITCKAYQKEDYETNGSSATEVGICNGVSDGILPTTNDILVTNTIEVGIIQIYVIELTYVDSGIDQSDDMNKIIEGKINIIDTKNTIDLSGTVSNYEEGDYVQTNSIQRISQIDSNGNFKIVGLELGEHTIRVFNANGEAKGSKTFTIQTGETSGINNDVITIDAKSRTFTIDIDASNETYTIGSEIKNNIPYKEGTLAYNIINNAMNASGDTSTIYSPTPLTTPAQTTSAFAYETDNVTEATSESSISLSTTYQGYYWTYGTDYTINESTGKFTLTGVNTCQYNDGTCHETLVGKYIISTSASSNSESTNKQITTTTNLSNIYLVTTAPESSTSTIKMKAKKISSIPYSTEKVLSVTSDDYGTSYYYRGGVEDNYVNFAGMCWRIVRIEGDGSIKIVLAAQKSCSEIGASDTGTAFIGTGNFGYIYDYVTNSSGATSTSKKYVADYLNTAESTSSMKYKLDAWLTSSGIDTSKLKKDEWCLGNTTDPYNSSGTLLTSTTADLMYSSTTFYYDTYRRLVGRGTTSYATLRCDGSNYETHESYIGALTADEVVFAGGKAGSSNYNYYLRENATSNWWTLSPSNFYLGYDGAFYVDYNGGVSYGAFVDDAYGSSLRPAVSLVSGTQFLSGDGSINNPYTIK